MRRCLVSTIIMQVAPSQNAKRHPACTKEREKMRISREFFRFWTCPNRHSQRFSCDGVRKKYSFVSFFLDPRGSKTWPEVHVVWLLVLARVTLCKIIPSGQKSPFHLPTITALSVINLSKNRLFSCFSASGVQTWFAVVVITQLIPC